MLRDFIKTMRPRQWTKNVFVLAGLVFDRQLSLTNTTPLLRTLGGFFIFCLLSSVIYIINDIMDVDADRHHPEKRFRPIASGRLPEWVATAGAVIILVIILPAAFLLSPGLADACVSPTEGNACLQAMLTPNFFIICVAYLLLNLAYSLWIKHIPLLDVLFIAAGFVFRVAAGVTIISVERFSPWLYVVTTLFALYIGFGKRRAELALLAGDANSHRRVLEGYTLPLLDQIITIVSGTTIVAYSLYTFSAPNLPDNHSMMLTIPFVLYGIFRYLYLIQVKQYGGAPEELLLSDRPLQATIVLWGITVLMIFYPIFS